MKGKGLDSVMNLILLTAMALYHLCFRHAVPHCQDAKPHPEIPKCPEGKDKPLPSQPTPAANLFLSCYYCLALGKERDGSLLPLVGEG